MPEWEERWPWQKVIEDQCTRELFLRDNQPFIRYVAGQVCHRTLEWGQDEELSEAFVAFNEAIKHFQPDRGVPFLAYARVLIKRRLIDFFRRQKTKETLTFDQDEAGQVIEANISIDEFIEQEQNNERASEIKEFAKELSKWGLNFQDLVAVSPKHRDSRETLLRAARELADDPELWSQVEQKGKVPMQALTFKTNIHPKVLERGRKYILAVAVLIANQNNFVYLREYVSPPERRNSYGNH